MTPLTILVDLDGITANLHAKWLAAINQEMGETLTVRDLTTFPVADAVRPENKDKVYPIIERPGFYKDLLPLEGCQGVISNWKRQGHEVIFCSSPPTPWGAGEKYQWIEDHFGHLGFTRKDVILANKKHKVKGDVLIDDYPKNIRKYKAAWPEAIALTIGYPYNEGETDLYDLIAVNWQRPFQAWQELDDYIQAVAS